VDSDNQVCGAIGATGAAVAANSKGKLGDKAREYGDKAVF